MPEELLEVGIPLYSKWAEESLITDVAINVGDLAEELLRKHDSSFDELCKRFEDQAMKAQSTISQIFSGNEIHKVWMWELAVTDCEATELTAEQLVSVCQDNSHTGPAKLFDSE